MPVVRSEIEIDAPPDEVFDILVDLERYPEWNPFTPRVESTLEIGDPVHLHTRLRIGKPLMLQVEYVTANERPSELCWGADIGARFLIRADRCQVLTPLDAGRTRYVCTDEIRGWLSPLVMLLHRDNMQRGFDDCARALKARAEAG
jgi:hypothetical protein